MSIHVLEYIKKNYKDHAIEANGVVIARYFVVEDHYKAEAYMEQNLLNIILEGKKMLHTKSGDVEVRAGEAFFLSRGEYVMSEVCEGGKYACLLIFFDEKVIGNWLSPILEKLPLHVKMPSHTPEPFCKIELTPIMKSTALSLLPFIEQKPAFVDRILVLKLQELLLLLLGSPEGSKLVSYFHTLLPRGIDLKVFMEANFAQNWSIAEFAKHSGRSLSAFKTEFASQLKATPMKWILDKRVEHAHFLIKKGGLSIGEASFRAGFKSQSHFTRLFKARHIQTPKDLTGKKSNLTD
ncbi:helix-turn-helix transcriptional regulator [Sulfurospirillum arsenophilum]|uniref:helix-turn-helix transcriptional regulator n=1 Tax=Sulfurospirillum arsenophilum TaxID=56698 RepID=UPI0005A9DBF8|nr:AraC family transcriptional regulator [Sulfurospirillum arsenophilum]